MAWISKLFGRTKPEREEFRIFSEKLGNAKIKHGEKSALVSYERNGEFDYATYREVQQAGNKRKLGNVFVDESMVRQIAEYSLKHIPVQFVICHGTRNGTEQRFFKSFLPGVTVIGTEISETATQFPDTIQWDFHDVRPEWIGKVDLIYSNSWDHSYDPAKLFAAWASCLPQRGLMAIEHTEKHEPDKVNALDPFGASLEGLIEVVANSSPLRMKEILHGSDERFRRRTVIFQR